MTNNAIQARWHFAVPIYEIILESYAQQKTNIVNSILSIRNKQVGITRSNVGGWHSDDQLHFSEDKNIQTLMQLILQATSASIHDFEKDRTHGEPVMTSAWANVNQAADWNLPHQHLPADWSGVFYVDIEESKDIDETKPSPGDILFYNPLPIGDRHKRACTTHYRPKNGLLLLFPSYLMHMVMPHNFDKPRLSISFNIRVPLTVAEIQAAENM